jgi:dCTP deaminase
MEYLRLLARDVIEDSIRAPLASIVRRIRKHVIGTSAGVTEACFGVADLLKERIAPSQDLKRAQTTPPAAYSVQETLNGAWLTLIEEVDQTETPIIWRDRLRNVSRLAMRGIELAHALVNYPVIHQQAWQDGFHKMLPHALRSPRSQRVTGVLTHKDLVERLLLPKGDLRLVVSPVMNTKQIGESSIDVRLGNAFYVVSKTRAEFFAIKRGRETRIPDRYYEFHKGTIDEEIVLHPGEFVLGSTLEYLSMPADLMAYVIGRSTIGRLGLIIATATHVAPGYKGTLTLELTNVGTVAIKLKPGVRIAQLVFHTLTSKVDSPYAEHGRYTFSVGPEIPKL